MARDGSLNIIGNGTNLNNTSGCSLSNFQSHLVQDKFLHVRI